MRAREEICKGPSEIKGAADEPIATEVAGVLSVRLEDQIEALDANDQL